MEFDEFVRLNYAPLVRFGFLLCRDRGRAEDIVQDALIKVYRRWERVNAMEYPRAYATRVVTSTYFSWRRRLASREIAQRSPVDTTDTTDARAQIDDRDVIWRLLATLSQRKRVAIVLRYYEDLSEAEIATTLQCRPATVRSLISRGLDNLRHAGIPAATPTSHEGTTP